MSKTLTFDPKKRLTVDEALEHPYLSAYHDPEDEPVVTPLSPSYFDFDREYCPPARPFLNPQLHFPVHKEELTKDQLKELLYEEVLSFVPAI